MINLCGKYGRCIQQQSGSQWLSEWLSGFLTAHQHVHSRWKIQDRRQIKNRPTDNTENYTQPRKNNQHKTQHNKNYPGSVAFYDTRPRTRWAYFTTLPRPHGASGLQTEAERCIQLGYADVHFPLQQLSLSLIGNLSVSISRSLTCC